MYRTIYPVAVIRHFLAVGTPFVAGADRAAPRMAVYFIFSPRICDFVIVTWATASSSVALEAR